MGPCTACALQGMDEGMPRVFTALATIMGQTGAQMPPQLLVAMSDDF